MPTPFPMPTRQDLGCDDPFGRAPPIQPLGFYPLTIGGALRPTSLMSAATILRGLSGLALPVLAIVSMKRRPSRRDRTGSPDVVVESRPPRRPSSRELARLVKEKAPLSGMDLSGMRLRRASLQDLSLSGSDLSHARLAGARLTRADLSGAILDFADMAGCDLREADMTGVSLVETTLWDADLRGADLSGSRNIIMANLRRARYDGSTRWPSRLDPRSLGAIRFDEGSPRSRSRIS